jgi:hypothetical protein
MVIVTNNCFVVLRKSFFGEDASVNVSVEKKDDNDKKLAHCEFDKRTMPLRTTRQEKGSFLAANLYAQRYVLFGPLFLLLRRERTPQFRVGRLLPLSSVGVR